MAPRAKQQGRLPFFASPLEDEPVPDHPDMSDANANFKEHDEASPGELFYDLFFVANLAVFTNVHEMNDPETMKQYIGFFALLWITWYQVSLYDVRFFNDSWCERVLKATQSGVMIGFALTGPNFDVSTNGSTHTTALEAFCLFIMTSRLVLFFQYVQAMYFTWMFRKTRWPMALTAATQFIAAFIYLGIYFSFKANHVHGYRAWYVVGAAETIACTAIPVIWDVLSFKRTYLVQRMSLLTLIILGEGVMGIAKICQALVQGDVSWLKPSAYVGIGSAVLIAYFVYMLYFDSLPDKEMRTDDTLPDKEMRMDARWQQPWALLHFPLHLSLVLCLEGASQFIAWRAATVQTNDLIDRLSNLDYNNASALVAPLQRNVDQIMNSALHNIKSTQQFHAVVNSNTTAYRDLSVIANATSQIDSEEDAVYNIFSVLINTIYESIGFNPSEAIIRKDEDANAQDYQNAKLNATAEDIELDSISESIAELCELIYIYFVVTAGLVIIWVCIASWLGKRRTSIEDRVKLAMTFALGTGLCLLAVLDINDQLWANFVSSPWVVPTVMATMALAVVINNSALPLSHGKAEVKNPQM